MVLKFILGWQFSRKGRLSNLFFDVFFNRLLIKFQSYGSNLGDFYDTGIVTNIFNFLYIRDHQQKFAKGDFQK